jgi:hypothetical protein
MNVHVLITAPWKRLRKAAPLPHLQCTELEAKHWFSGYWHGLGLGVVIGAGFAAVLLR